MGARAGSGKHSQAQDHHPLPAAEAIFQLAVTRLPPAHAQAFSKVLAVTISNLLDVSRHEGSLKDSVRTAEQVCELVHLLCQAPQAARDFDTYYDTLLARRLLRYVVLVSSHIVLISLP